MTAPDGPAEVVLHAGLATGTGQAPEIGQPTDQDQDSPGEENP